MWMWMWGFEPSRQSNRRGRRRRSGSLIVSAERRHRGIRCRDFVSGSAAVDISSQLLKSVIRTHAPHLLSPLSITDCVSVAFKSVPLLAISPAVSRQFVVLVPVQFVMEVLDHAFRVRRNILQGGTPLGSPIEDLLGLFNGQNLRVDQLKHQHLDERRDRDRDILFANLSVFTLTIFPAAVA